MPKERATTRKTAKKDGGKKKKGMYYSNCFTYHGALRLTSSPDPNAPKRGLSAYMFFANEQREKVREENPGIKFGKLNITHNPTIIAQ